MGIPTTLRCNSSSLSQCTHCSVLRFQPLTVPSSLDFPRQFRRCPLQFLAVSRLGNRRKVDFICRVGEDNIEPDANDNKEKDNQEGNVNGGLTDSRTENGLQFEKEKEQVSNTEALNSLNNFIKDNQIKVSGEGGTQEKDNQQENGSGSLTDSSLENYSQSEKEKEQVSTTEALNSLSNFIKNNQSKVNGEGVTQDDPDKLQVSSGSPLPGVKPQQLDETIRIPKETIDILRDQVFGFDTFFVTGQEPYEGGVLFKGNLRGVASESYAKLSKRLQDRLGDQYKLFILNNPEDDKPVAVVVPRITLQPETTAVPEWFAAGSFGLVTLFTLLLRNVPELQSDLLSSFDKLELLKNGLPGALVTALILGVHELGHYFVAKDCGVKLGVPYLIPSWQIGSFGAITRIVNIVPKREVLLKIAAAGPLAGYSLGLILFFLGFILPTSDGLGIVVDGSVFHESLLVGGTAKLLLGDVLKEGQAISLNPLVLWAWAGLLVNAINSIPAGELDGGRISFAIWGRKASVRFTGASIVLLGLSSLFNDVAFYWVVLIYILQRGPIAPLSEEISEPDQKNVALGILVLLLGLLVCLPYPFPFANEALTTL